MARRLNRIYPNANNRCPSFGRVAFYTDRVSTTVIDVKRCVRAVGHSGMHKWGYVTWSRPWRGEK